ncbi:outer dense fiber protein 3-like isoform X1 [Gigantopelta aegis]|uniref:outer dense fiber protein 3-like isoform X1 n=1 Tax=Gigantopelta aegis TaxID=1735272 RepID=UPI001B8894F1|nr:outer dense fiber protein 3-like isoform X1 [Gigantopelta aegis]
MACKCEVTQSTWQPTRPRGPIAAMYASPGPQYQLPGLVGGNFHDPRSVHNKRPIYSFGIRHGKFSDDSSPGPAYYPDSKMYRDGKDGTPHYSLHSRHRDFTMAKTPGPGAYRPEEAGPTAAKSAPKYSFGSRHRSRGTDQTPGPNVYNLPPMLGKTAQGGKKQAPIFSLTGRSKIGSFHEDMQKTPGPANYSVCNPNLYREKKPQYSLTSRNPMPSDTTTKPGPGAHSPEKVCMDKRCDPAFSFGVRHSAYVAPLIVDPID